MRGRVITVQFRGTARQIAYTISSTEPEAFLWWSVDFADDKPLTHAELRSIEAVCLGDLRERRAEWQAQLLRRRAADDSEEQRGAGC
jgi:hypothetical protein